MINTEYKFLKELSSRGIFIPPQTIVINSHLKKPYKNGTPVLKIIQTTSVYIFTKTGRVNDFNRAFFFQNML
jgi:hypothetical protein